jgi:hypothetical protein
MIIDKSLVANSRMVYLIFCLSLLSVPFNITFFQIVRAPDILFVLAVIVYATSNPKIKSIYIIIYSLFFGGLLLSSLVSMLHNNDIRYTGIIFYYKYSLLFLIPFVVTEVVNSRKRLQSVVSILYYVYLFLVIWVFIYYILRTNDLIQGNPRVSYPFSYYHMSDAHVYSSYLSFTFVAYYEYIKDILNHRKIHYVVLFMVSSVALFLTGSKTGILILIAYSSLILVRFFRTFRKRKIKLVIITLFVITLFNFLLPQEFVFYQDAEALFLRATTVNLEDNSISSRQHYFFVAINEIIPNLLLIGNGPIGASQKWYDGGFSILLAHSGLLGVFVLLFYIWMFFIKSRNFSSNMNFYNLHKTFTLLILTYLLLSVITEHYLLTRNVLPIVTLLSVIYVNIKLNYLDSLRIKTFQNE